MKRAAKMRFSNPARMGEVEAEAIHNLGQGDHFGRMVRIQVGREVGYIPMQEFLGYATKVLATERGEEYHVPPPGVTVATCYGCTQQRAGTERGEIEAWAGKHEVEFKHQVYVESGMNIERAFGAPRHG